MRRFTNAALLCLVAAASCGNPLAPLPMAEPPRELTYDVNTGFARPVRVRLAGDTVVFVASGHGPQGAFTTETRRVPSPAEWQTFWAAVRDAGVRRWPSRCGDSPELDGGGFDFSIAWAGARRSGSYFNAYPTRAGRCSGDHVDAGRFQQAVLSVAGVPTLVALRAR